MNFHELLPWNWSKKQASEAADRPSDLPIRHLRSPQFFGLDELFLRPFGLSEQPLRSMFGNESGGFMPALNATDSDEQIRIEVELPGLSEKDVEISIADDPLTIKGEKQEEHERNEDGAQWVERRFGSFRRVIPMPEDIAADKIHASYDKGVLQIVAPRSGEAQKRRRSIPIHKR